MLQANEKMHRSRKWSEREQHTPENTENTGATRACTSRGRRSSTWAGLSWTKRNQRASWSSWTRPTSNRMEWTSWTMGTRFIASVCAVRAGAARACTGRGCVHTKMGRMRKWPWKLLRFDAVNAFIIIYFSHGLCHTRVWSLKLT